MSSWTRWATGVAVAVVLAGCGAEGFGAGDGETVAVRLVDAMVESEVQNPVAAPKVEPTLWSFDGSAGSISPR